MVGPGPFSRRGLFTRTGPFIGAAVIAIVALVSPAGSLTVAQWLALAAGMALLVLALVPLDTDRVPGWVHATACASALGLALWPEPAGARAGLQWEALGTLCLVACAIFLVPWERLPRSVQSLPPLGALVALFALRAAASTPAIGIFPLVALAVLFLALHHQRVELGAGLLMAALVFIAAPVVAGTAPDVVGGIVMSSLLTVLGVTVHEVVDQARRAEIARRDGELQLSTVIDSTVDGIVTLDEQGNIVAANRSVQAMFVTSALDMLGRPIGRFIDSAEGPQFAAHLAAQMHPGRGLPSGSFETLGFRPDGSTFPLEFRVTRATLEGRALHVATLRDISDQKRAAQVLEYRAVHDPLTGLPNRALFDDRLAQALRLSRRSGTRPSVLVVDLDHFKVINDTHGHAVGDVLLHDVAQRLVDGLRSSDTVARIGGDEFAVIPGGPGITGGTATAAKVVSALARPFVLGDQVFLVSASVGIAVHPDHGDSAEELLQAADAAMYRAKRERLGFCVAGPRTVSAAG
ncbi:MAG: diguanylate cyclase domain-containing protein [Candidatus Dormibacteria bacterium]